MEPYGYISLFNKDEGSLAEAVEEDRDWTPPQGGGSRLAVFKQKYKSSITNWRRQGRKSSLTTSFRIGTLLSLLISLTALLYRCSNIEGRSPGKPSLTGASRRRLANYSSDETFERSPLDFSNTEDASLLAEICESLGPINFDPYANPILDEMFFLAEKECADCAESIKPAVTSEHSAGKTPVTLSESALLHSAFSRVERGGASQPENIESPIGDLQIVRAADLQVISSSSASSEDTAIEATTTPMSVSSRGSEGTEHSSGDAAGHVESGMGGLFRLWQNQQKQLGSVSQHPSEPLRHMSHDSSREENENSSEEQSPCEAGPSRWNFQRQENSSITTGGILRASKPEKHLSNVDIIAQLFNFPEVPAEKHMNLIRWTVTDEIVGEQYNYKQMNGAVRTLENYMSRHKLSEEACSIVLQSSMHLLRSMNIPVSPSPNMPNLRYYARLFGVFLRNVHVLYRVTCLFPLSTAPDTWWHNLFKNIDLLATRKLVMQKRTLRNAQFLLWCMQAIESFKTGFHPPFELMKRIVTTYRGHFCGYNRRDRCLTISDYRSRHCVDTENFGSSTDSASVPPSLSLVQASSSDEDTSRNASEGGKSGTLKLGEALSTPLEARVLQQLGNVPVVIGREDLTVEPWDATTLRIAYGPAYNVSGPSLRSIEELMSRGTLFPVESTRLLHKTRILIESLVPVSVDVQRMTRAWFIYYKISRVLRRINAIYRVTVLFPEITNPGHWWEELFNKMEIRKIPEIIGRNRITEFAVLNWRCYEALLKLQARDEVCVREIFKLAYSTPGSPRRRSKGKHVN